MAKAVISPGVFTNEIDQTFLPAAVADIGGAIVGPTVKGPVLTPTIVSSYSDFQNVFGDSFRSGSNYYQYLTSHTAKEYLRHNNTLTVVRILAGNYSHASASISSSVDPTIVGGVNPTVPVAGDTPAKHSASLTIPAGAIGYLGTDASASLTPRGGNEVKFVFTGSNAPTNTSTAIYVLSSSGAGSVANDKAQSALNLAHALGSSSLHGLDITASAAAAVVNITMSRAGAFGVPTGSRAITHINTTTADGTGKYLDSPGSGESISTGNFIDLVGSYGLITTKSFGGGRDFNAGRKKVPFKLHTHGVGTIMNNYNSQSVNAIGTNNLLLTGSSNNLRWEISKLNQKKGTFSLSIRSGDDVENRKQILETFNNVNLDPNSSGYIGKAIGDQIQTIRTDENGKPFLQLSGSYPNKSKYVRVEVFEQTIDYLDENGEVRVPGASASLPTFHSGSNSGSRWGSFGGGSDGTVAAGGIGDYTYESISENNSQGLDPSGDGGDNGYNQYIQALDLLSNQDEYDINLILTPGIIASLHTSVASKVIDVCETRGDCFAIIDPVDFSKNITNATDQAKTRNSNYAAMYWPWVKVADLQVAGTMRWVPPSVVMAGVYGFNDKVGHQWTAPAGLNRGVLSQVAQTERNLTISDRDTLYDSNVNPIATFPGQGVVVWGQKTLQKKPTALDRVNVRRLLIRLKKFIASSSRFLVFEQNTAATRRKFLGIVNPFMEQIQAQSGLSEFRVVMDESNNTPDTIDRNQLVGQIFVQPTRTAEFIVLDFTVQPTGASFPV
tara:strand:- start:5922 stop:8264 length:2343 start_codon:yes stop_codon:yes gene_type:complete